MKRIAIALTAALAFGLSACGSVDAGTVVDKSIKDAWSEEVEIMEEECEWDTDTKMVNGKSKTTQEWECEDVGTGEYETVEHPPEYTLVLENKDGDTGEVKVNEDTFNSVEEGEWFGEKE